MTYDVRAINGELGSCDLSFKEQCKIVAEGIKKGFSYDGCTAVPDFNFGYDCCGEHDYYYQSKEVDRAVADKKLYECILRKGIPYKLFGVIPGNSNAALATIYYIGVRLAGWFFWNKRKVKGTEHETSETRNVGPNADGP